MPKFESVDPTFAFAFLQTFIDILQEYFGSVNAATLKENFDVVYQVTFASIIVPQCLF